MIKICPDKFPVEDETEELKEIFSQWPFELDHFQKFAVQAIEEGHHALITSHTGSGKTLGAEHAIQRFCRAGEKVVYTAPIKSLSNQKFHEFTEKYPDISFGILTGDIKFNPEADCVIATTEILRNALVPGDNNSKQEFTLDADSIRCVIFDEVHYINDASRGMVWEETIMRLPSKVQTVMLSATIDRAQQFAQWVAETTGRQVWLTSTDVRVVPLNHYSWWLLHPSSVKKLLGTPVEALVGDINDTFIPLKKANTRFKPQTVNNLHKVTREIAKQRVQLPRRKYVFNSIAQKLKGEGLLPAICFVFSRAKVMEHAAEIQHNLFGEGDKKRTAIVEQECKRVLMSKLPDFRDYENLPEFRQLVGLLQKGIAVHHSGMLPVLKEMVEMMFAKGFVKLLFATETFAVGINMPTKTVLFSSLEKFDGDGFRLLHSHEYTQMAGRAGRRGLDTVGHVIHLNNLFEVPYTQEYKRMLSGSPQSLVSKFDVNFDIVLRGSAGIADQSMMMLEIERELRAIQGSIDALEAKLAAKPPLKHSEEQLRDYHDLQTQIAFSKNKKRRRFIRQVKDLEQSCPGIDESYQAMQSYREMKDELTQRRQEYQRVTEYVERRTTELRHILQERDFMDEEGKLTIKGRLASCLQEVARLPFAEVLMAGEFDDLEADELAAMLSCFTSVRVSDDVKQHQPVVQAPRMKRIHDTFNRYYDLELKACGYVDDSYSMFHYDLQATVMAWCHAQNEIEAREVIQSLPIFLGEFSKAVLKINAIAQELQRVCEVMDPPNLQLKQQLSRIPEQTLKFVVSNQSLYV